MNDTSTDAYIAGIVAARSHSALFDLALISELQPHIRGWANGHRFELQLSGSRAKGTSIVGSTDLDVFISLDPSVGDYNTLEYVYESLGRRLTSAGYAVREQNVSLGILHNGLSVDVVPGVRQNLIGTDHSLYKRKVQSWTKTNIQKHIVHVGQSGRTFDIRAIKIWRNLWDLSFSSFYLELSVLQALSGRPLYSPSANFVAILNYLADEFTTRSITDPANTNNCVSDEMTAAEKQTIANAAARALRSQWAQVIW